MKPPKFIREFYKPSAREWLRWLRFSRKVKTIAAQGHDALNDYFEACSKNRRITTSSFSRSGMYPGSDLSTRTLEMFEWASFGRRVCFQGVSISVSYETHDDILDLVYTNNF